MSFANGAIPTLNFFQHKDRLGVVEDCQTTGGQVAVFQQTGSQVAESQQTRRQVADSQQTGDQEHRCVHSLGFP